MSEPPTYIDHTYIYINILHQFISYYHILPPKNDNPSVDVHLNPGGPDSSCVTADHYIPGKQKRCLPATMAAPMIQPAPSSPNHLPCAWRTCAAKEKQHHLYTIWHLPGLVDEMGISCTWKPNDTCIQKCLANRAPDVPKATFQPWLKSMPPQPLRLSTCRFCTQWCLLWESISFPWRLLRLRLVV